MKMYLEAKTADAHKKFCGECGRHLLAHEWYLIELKESKGGYYLKMTSTECMTPLQLKELEDSKVKKSSKSKEDDHQIRMEVG